MGGQQPSCNRLRSWKKGTHCIPGTFLFRKLGEQFHYKRKKGLHYGFEAAVTTAAQSSGHYEIAYTYGTYL